MVATDGAGRRHPLAEYEVRLEKEIGVIRRSGYFLIVWHFIRYARNWTIPWPAGAARRRAAWSPGVRITDIDPIESHLYLERFLNEERNAPDIDIVFADGGEVIEYVTRKYGRENVAQIMKAKAVVCDVGRVMDLGYAPRTRSPKQRIRSNLNHARQRAAAAGGVPEGIRASRN